MRRLLWAAIFGAGYALLAPAFAHATSGEGSAQSGDPIAHVALLLALILVGAKIGGELATRLKQPAVLGELVAGMVIGNLPMRPLGDVAHEPSIDMLSRLGVLVLLFEVGLESTVRDVLEVGATAARVAVLGTCVTLAVGWGMAWWINPGAGTLAHAFVGASLTATSVGITARVFKDIGQTRSIEARTILGAAVIDDVFGLLILALATGFIARQAEGGSVSAFALAWIALKTVGFLAVAVWVGVQLTPRLFRVAAGFRTGGMLLAVGLAFCLMLAWAADKMGLAPIIGAFAAGLILEDLHSASFVARGERSLSQRIEPISEFLVPIFFVVMGMRADIAAFVQPSTLLLAFALTLAACVGKLACALGAPSGVRRLAIAFGMMPRGEVSLIFASIGLTLQIGGKPVLDAKGYSALVTMVILTTVLTPPLLKWSFGKPPAGTIRIRAARGAPGS